MGLLLKRPCWQVKCLRGFIDEPTRVQGIRNLGPEPSNFIGEKLDVLRCFSTGDDFYGCFLKRFRFLDQCFELGNPSFSDDLIRIAFPKNHRLYGQALKLRFQSFQKGSLATGISVEDQDGITGEGFENGCLLRGDLGSE